MSKSVKLKNDIYLDSSSIVHGRYPIENYLVIERGSNSNGTWTKYANGDMECSGKVYVNPSWQQDDSIFLCRNITFPDFPVEFKEIPWDISIHFMTTQLTTRYIIPLHCQEATIKNIGLCALMTYWNADYANGYLTYRVKGRWK